MACAAFKFRQYHQSGRNAFCPKCFFSHAICVHKLVAVFSERQEDDGGAGIGFASLSSQIDQRGLKGCTHAFEILPRFVGSECWAEVVGPQSR